ETGWLQLAPAFGYGPLRGTTNKGELKLPIVNHQAMQLEDFATCVLENRESSVSGEEGLKDMKVIEAIYRSIATGGKVKVS
ncbi:MAG TPA: Gfo/Idh/MocA family oxidoreductase, partial [Ohtaekwangia sp.]|nr:Gfo/Idh/MocA family oxidoreductase [Ohtaekwangia sp.]